MFLSGKPRGTQVDLKDLEYAIQQLKKCTVVGVVDRIDESLVVGEHKLKNYFDNIDFAYVSKNISEERSNNLEERLDIGRHELGEKLFNKLKSVNQLDLQLYSEANKILNEKIVEQENFEDKIQNFKNRCKKLL